MSYKYTYERITEALEKRKAEFYGKINPIAST